MAHSTAEEMALEVLRGNLQTARYLAELLMETTNCGTAKEIPPVHKLTVDRSKLRILLTTEVSPTDEQVDLWQARIRSWLDGNDPLLIVLNGRVELFEMPLADDIMEQAEEVCKWLGIISRGERISGLPLPGVLQIKRLKELIEKDTGKEIELYA